MEITMERLKNWKSSLVGVVAILAVIFGLAEPDVLEVSKPVAIIIQALAGLWLIFRSKD